MSQNSSSKNNSPETNIISENEEKFKKLFYNTENLENIYNILKGDEKQLKKETIKKLIEDFDGVEYEEIKDESTKSSNQITSSKFNSSKNKKDFEEKTNNTGDMSFGEFCDIFKNIYESSLENSNKIFLEGFCFMDKDKKSYLDIEDLKRCNQLLNQNFTEDELEGLLELAGKSEGKITFENFTEFLLSDNNQ